LSRYASLASTSFLSSIPIVHNGSLILSDLPAHIAFALTVAGAAYDREGEMGRVFCDDVLPEKALCIVRNFNDKRRSDDDKFGILQSLVIYQLLGFFHWNQDRELISSVVL
jgi:hypothetical protein